MAHPARLTEEEVSEYRAHESRDNAQALAGAATQKALEWAAAEMKLTDGWADKDCSCYRLAAARFAQAAKEL